MFVNLHNLPVGQSMYTVYVGESLDMADEVDVVASSRATAQDVLEAAKGELEGYEGHALGVVNQSDGYIMWRA